MDAILKKCGWDSSSLINNLVGFGEEGVGGHGAAGWEADDIFRERERE